MAVEIQNFMFYAAKAYGAKEALKELIVQLRGEVESMQEVLEQANLRSADARALLTATPVELDQMRATGAG
ncbi:hypothetical protein [Pseudomonas viridiflava]|uniref:hypothetical protein n=1 Tax=Pseudomonas viridiflava TaxID=33069 RepID=UPI001C3129BD|nr:hypothetical protein [Pseudomonas viridiflava]QXG49964.1 hypothetical protein KTT57_13470 [Pseudomonas viridiflava]